MIIQILFSKSRFDRLEYRNWHGRFLFEVTLVSCVIRIPNPNPLANIIFTYTSFANWNNKQPIFPLLSKELSLDMHPYKSIRHMKGGMMDLFQKIRRNRVKTTLNNVKCEWESSLESSLERNSKKELFPYDTINPFIDTTNQKWQICLLNSFVIIT